MGHGTPAQDYWQVSYIEVSKARQKKAKGFDDNKALKIGLEKELNYFSQKYLKKLFSVSNEEYPFPKLPVMSDNVKARSFVADYLNDQITNGSEASKHTGCSNFEKLIVKYFLVAIKADRETSCETQT